MDKTGKILNDKESKIRRWLEHFSEVLNRKNPINPVCEMEIELPDEIQEIDTSEPSRAEVRKAIGHLKNGKAPGIDNIQAELLKADFDYATTKVKESHGHSVERREDTKEMEKKTDCQTAEERKSERM